MSRVFANRYCGFGSSTFILCVVLVVVLSSLYCGAVQSNIFNLILFFNVLLFINKTTTKSIINSILKICS